MINDVQSALKKLKSLKGIFLFIIITLIIHYSFRYWANPLHFYPFAEQVQQLRQLLADIAFQHTTAVLHFLGFTFTEQNNTLTYADGSWLAINKSCSGFKQLLQALLLFVLYPGKLKHKLWFIPMALLLMHIANIIRLTGVSITLFYYGHLWEFSHDYVFRFVFYLILFLLWVWWEEQFNNKGKKNRVED